MATSTASRETETNSYKAVLARLRSLVRGLCNDSGHDDDSSEQVLMDVDLDGYRYLLIRMSAVERRHPSLSPREVEIVRLVAEGRPNKVIAAVLEISSWTVCTHIRRVFAKLGVSSRAAMIARLAEFGGTLDGFSSSLAQRTNANGDDTRGTALCGPNSQSSKPVYRPEPQVFTTQTGANDPENRSALKLALARRITRY
jgi:DNA-binding CsgD family transcriptional regulator